MEYSTEKLRILMVVFSSENGTDLKEINLIEFLLWLDNRKAINKHYSVTKDVLGGNYNGHVSSFLE